MDTSALLRRIYGGDESWEDWMEGRRPVTVGSPDPQLLLHAVDHDGKLGSWLIDHLNAPTRLRLYTFGSRIKEHVKRADFLPQPAD